MSLRASNLPTTRPSLTLDFAKSRRLDPRITFARNSIGTVTNSSGQIVTVPANVPRFDHNPTTGESLGLLVEEARTNLQVRSEEFDNTGTWSRTGLSTVTANSSVAPDGLTTADTLVEDASTGSHRVFAGTSSLVASASYSFSVHVKASTRTVVRVEVRDSVGAFAVQDFNLTTQAITSAGSGTGAISALGNGWFRCTITGTTSVSGGVGVVLIYSMQVAGNVNYTGTNGTSAILLWGAQLEAGAFPTSYIPTTTAAATRSADVVQITGTAFSGWYRQDEGTVFYDGTVSQRLTAFPWFYNISDGTVNNSIGVYQFTNGNYASVITGGVAAIPDLPVFFTPVSGAAAKHALAVKASDTRAAFNGTLSQAQANTVMPVVNQLSIGQRVNGNRMTGHIRRLVYWGQRLPNNVLQAITQ